MFLHAGLSDDCGICGGNIMTPGHDCPIENVYTYIAANVYCPSCEYVMLRVGRIVKCIDSDCKYYGIEYKQPKILLEKAD